MAKSIRLYETEIQTLLELPEASRSRILTAILCDCLGEDFPELDPMEKAVYVLINAQVKRAEDLSSKRKQSANSRWNGDTKSETDNANVMQNNANPETEDTNPCTNTITITNTNTITKTSTDKSPARANEKPAAEIKKSALQKPKPEKKQFGEFVSMTNEEYSSLVAKLGEHGAKRCVEILDNYKGANDKKYNSDYRAILNWVVERYKEEQAKQPKKKTAPSSFDAEEIMRHIHEQPPDAPSECADTQELIRQIREGKR